MEKYIVDGQDPKVTEKLYSKILDMLTLGEDILYIALQKKPAVTLFPDSISVTNKRLFLGEFTKLGFATNFEIFAWEDVKDIAFKEEIFGSKVTLIPYTGENLTIDYIPKIQARKLYQYIKDALENNRSQTETKKETIIIEHKPIIQQTTSEPSGTQRDYRESDESMEYIPSMYLKPESNQTNNPSTNSTPYKTEMSNENEDEIVSKLKKLKVLFDKQLISQAEYESKKVEILKDL